MHIAEITKKAGRDRRPRRIGRGEASGAGKTAGRGHKGGGSRSGWKQRGLQEGGQMPTFRRIPKRGFSNVKFRTEYNVVNLDDLEAKYETNAHVTPQSMHEFGLVRSQRGPIKVLGDGKLTKKLKVDAAAFSKSAKEKIESVGGEARVI